MHHLETCTYTVVKAESVQRYVGAASSHSAWQVPEKSFTVHQRQLHQILDTHSSTAVQQML